MTRKSYPLSGLGEILAVVGAGSWPAPYAALHLLKLGDTAPYHPRVAEDKLERWPREALWICSQGALGRLIHEDEADVARDARGIGYVRRSRAVSVYAVRARDILARRLLSGEIAGQHTSPVSYEACQ